MSAVASSLPQHRMAIHELSARIAAINGRVTDPELQLPEIPVPPTEDLEAVIKEMTANGYTVGEPVRHFPSRKRPYTEWHIQVANAEYCAVLAFFVEEKAC
jgi:hypothetical protein